MSDEAPLRRRARRGDLQHGGSGTCSYDRVRPDARENHAGRVMEAEISREIEQLTGRKVVGFMSDNHIDPDLAVEVFVLEPLHA